MTDTARDLGPNNAYLGAVSDVRTLLDRIASTIDADNSGPDRGSRNWGEVGDMLRIREQLLAISDQLHRSRPWRPWMPHISETFVGTIVADDGHEVEFRNSANAHLISAAPELLAALRLLLCASGPHERARHNRVARAAIAKAEGRA